MKQNFRTIAALALASTALLASCNKDDDSIAPIVISIGNTYTVDKCKMIEITPTVTGTTSASFCWTLADSVISTDSTLHFITATAGIYSIKLKVSDAQQADSATIAVTVNEASYSDRITKVLAYDPTFGYYMNQRYTGSTRDEVIAKINAELSPSLVSMDLPLGFFGGSAIFAFDHPIVNVAGQNDFSIMSASTQCSAGIVFVSYDKNHNGIADDEWYEIQGDLEGTPYLTANYELTVSGNRIDDDSEFVSTNAWTDNQGKSGVYSNTLYPYSNDPYPTWLTGDLALKGKLIDISAETRPKIADKMTKYIYASGLAAYKPMDIAWAVDANGKPANLPAIDFVKIVVADFTIDSPFSGCLSLQINQIRDLHLQTK